MHGGPVTVDSPVRLPRVSPLTEITHLPGEFGEKIQASPRLASSSLAVPWDTSEKEDPGTAADFFVTYDGGFVLRPRDARRHPFEFKVGGRLQIRHVGFTSDVDSWTDRAGVTRAVRDRNHFELERVRLLFMGFAFSPQWEYFLQLDGDTDERETVEAFDYWWTYRGTSGVQAGLGMRRLPASRQWILSSAFSRLADRPMATDFFRPDRSIGVWLNRKFDSKFFAEVMLANGFRSNGLTPLEMNLDPTVLGTAYWDPWGDFGEQITDWENHARPVIRVGNSAAFASQSRQSEDGGPLPESTFVRLSDGTRLTDLGALQPGRTVTDFDLWLYTVDFAVKYRGFSFNAEFYFRWLNSLRDAAGGPFQNIFDRGFFMEGGYFLIPRTLDVNVRYSQIDGPFGTAEEYGVGIDWFPTQSPRLRFAWDITVLDGSPLDNSSSEIRVGDDGVLFRTQVDTFF